MIISELLNTETHERDSSWEVQFLEAFINCQVELLSDQPQFGPDGFPYLFVETSPKGTEPVLQIIDWLSSRGIGLAVNAYKKLPDYIFSYGMIWNFKERRRFIEPISHKSEKLLLEPGNPIYFGNLSLVGLPSYARNILREFFAEQGILNPKVLAISQDQKEYDVCFSLNSLGFPPVREHRGIAEAIGWFFPFNTPIVLIEEKGLPPFYDL